MASSLTATRTTSCCPLSRVTESGYRNGNPDGYGWFDHGVMMPLTADRTPDYYFPRYMVVPPTQLFMPNYYNPYVSRGQRFIPFAGCGGPHPVSGPPTGLGGRVGPSVQRDAEYDAEGHGPPVQRPSRGPAGQPGHDRPSPLIKGNSFPTLAKVNIQIIGWGTSGGRMGRRPSPRSADRRLIFFRTNCHR